MDKELKTAIKAIKKAGKKILKIYQKDYKTFYKKDTSPVTEADLISEKIILSKLKKFNYGILSEEKDDNKARLNKEKVWIIDPLDGTNDLLDKTGQFSIMIGLVKDKRPILGIVYQPTKDKLYFARENQGTYLKKGKQKPKKLTVSNISDLSKSHFVVSRSHLDKKTKKVLQDNKVKKITPTGSVGVKIGKIVEGKAEGYISLSNKTGQWDICAPQIILEQAGGKLTDLNGQKYIYNRKQLKNKNGILATNRKIHSIIKVSAY